MTSPAEPAPEGPEPPLLPVFLKLRGRKVLLVGGGQVASSKLHALLSAGARVTVVAPEIRGELDQPGVELRRRPFAPQDLDGVWFVIAAAPPAVNRQVEAAAEARHLFVNAVDDPSAASAYLGGVVRRAGVTIAVSTDGRSPALAGLLREGIEAVLPDEETMESWLATAQALRQAWRALGVPMTERRPLLLQALNRLYEERGPYPKL